MTQLGEAVSPPGVDFNEVGCPFDHEISDPPSVDNDVIGNGTTLRARMKAGASTGTYRYADKQAKILNPKDVASSNIAREEADHGFRRGKRLPAVVCGAPSGAGQESLKRSSLLKYMVKKNSSEKLKGGSFDKGGVWCDVGYDVNGIQNGVYLPGSYAVGGGRGGMNVWTQEGRIPASQR